jgi:hypothetical protein
MTGRDDLSQDGAAQTQVTHGEMMPYTHLCLDARLDGPQELLLAALDLFGRGR